MSRVTSLLGVAYEKQGNAEAYRGLLDDYLLFLDKYEKNKEREAIENLEIQYQVKQKNASISQLEENKQQQQQIITQQRIIAIILGGLLVLFSGLGYLFWKQRKLKNQYEKENLEQRLLRSQMNPHFVSNALNTVNALVDKKSDNVIPYINKLANLFRLTLSNSREEFISLNDEIAAVKYYLELQSNLSQDFDFSIKVDDEIDGDEIIIPPMLIQPFVENAILHGLVREDSRGKVTIEFTKNIPENLLQCNINDNGIGFQNSIKITKPKKHKSISGDIVKERLAILKKKFKVNTRYTIMENENQGTLVELYLPYLID